MIRAAVRRMVMAGKRLCLTLASLDAAGDV